VEFTEVKTTFLKTLVINGFTSLAEIPPEIIYGIPKSLLEKWLFQFKNAPPLTAIPQSPRLSNRFTLGADPEFTFFNGAVKYPVMRTGLQTGLAFGMDMNGRLVELRPAPSRFALNIVASILAELRWMAIIYPETCNFSWQAIPFDGEDGVGGHVHFARKRDNEDRQLDIEILKNVYSVLYRTGVFNQVFCDRRIKHTKYGNNNDFRLQKHGYEYRAFPTWLDSPWLVHFVLTVTKLAMFDMNLFRNLANLRVVHILEQALINLVSYYKNIDDDAWIAFYGIKKWGIPKQEGQDFRTNWGILYPKTESKIKADKRYYPLMIEPTDNERNSIFQYIVNQVMIKPERPMCNWQPESIPKNYCWIMNYVQTYHKVGIGEIACDLVTHKSFSIDLLCDEDKNRLTSYTPQSMNCHQGIAALLKLVPGIRWQNNQGQENNIQLYLPAQLRNNEFIPLVKRVLTSGLFPIWNVHEVKEGCFEEWVKRNEIKTTNRLVGKEIV